MAIEPIPHDHALPVKGHFRIYTAVWLLAIGIVTLELVGAWFSGSRALLADVGHVASDTVLALVPLVALMFMRIGVNGRQVAFVASLVAAAILLWVGIHVGGEAWGALMGDDHHDHEVDGWLLFAFSGAAALANFFQHRLLSKIDREHRHGAHAGLHFHVIMDLVKNLALPVLGIAIALHILPDHADLWAALIIGALLIIRALILLYATLIPRKPGTSGHRHA